MCFPCGFGHDIIFPFKKMVTFGESSGAFLQFFDIQSILVRKYLIFLCDVDIHYWKPTSLLLSLRPKGLFIDVKSTHFSLF